MYRISPQQAGAHRGTFCRILSLSFDRAAQQWHCHQSVGGWPGLSSARCLSLGNLHTWMRGSSIALFAECCVHRWLYKCIQFRSSVLIHNQERGWTMHMYTLLYEQVMLWHNHRPIFFTHKTFGDMGALINDDGNNQHTLLLDTTALYNKQYSLFPVIAWDLDMISASNRILLSIHFPYLWPLPS